MAVQQPCSCIVGDHVRGDHAHRQEGGDVGPHMLNGHRIAMPVRGVQFEIAGGHQVPPDVITRVHR